MNVWIIHGLLGAVAVLIIYPLGILKRRMRITTWLSHSVIQSIGICMSLITSGIGLYRSREFHDMHQYSGVILILVVYSQLFFGLVVRDIHKDSGAKLYLQMYHAIQGFTALGLGWFTTVTGLLLASWSSTVVIVIALCTAVEVAAIPVICWWTLDKSTYLPVANLPEIRISGDDDDIHDHINDKELGAFDGCD